MHDFIKIKYTIEKITLLFLMINDLEGNESKVKNGF